MQGNKGAAITKLVIWAVIGCVLIATLCVGIGVDGVSDFLNGPISFVSGEKYDETGYLKGSQNYTGELKSINIAWASGNVNIQIYDGEEIKVEEKIIKSNDDDNAMRTKLENGNLSIKFLGSGHRISLFEITKKDLNVSIPRAMVDVLDKIEVNCASADISVNGKYDEDSHISLDSIVINTASGETSLKEIDADKLAINCSSGDIDINGNFTKADISTSSSYIDIKGNVDELTLECASGDLNFSGELGKATVEMVSGSAVIETFKNVPSKMTLEAVSGRIELSLPDTDEGFLVLLDSVSGRIRSDEGSGKRYKHGSGTAIYEIETVSGDVIINVK